MQIKLSIGQKSVCAILVLAVILAATATVISYRVYADTMDEHYRTLAMNVAKTAASMADAEKAQRITDEVTSIYLKNPSPSFPDGQAEADYLAQYDLIRGEQEYGDLFETLEKVKESSGVLSLYIIYMDAKTMTCVYVVDADTSESACLPGTWDIIYPQNYEAMKTPGNGFPAYITNTEEFGWLCSAGAAILNDEGKVVAHTIVDISMNSVMQDRRDYLTRLMLILLSVTALLIVVFIRGVSQAVIRPINQLAQAASSYVSDKERSGGDGEKSAIELLDIHTGDEVENLCGAIKRMEREINGYIENLTAVTIEKERIGAELDVARRIQASMLPSTFPPFPDRPELGIYATMTPAKEVGGDFYDFFLVDEDHLAMVMADVSGKGVPAALFMVIARALIKNCAQTGLSPSVVLETVNDQLCENNEAEMFVTVWLGILEISSGRMRCANAGHEYPIYQKAGGEYALIRDKHGFVLAGMPGARYREYELSMSAGDKIFLYTDGVTEATDASESLYGLERTLRTLNEHRNAAPRDLLPAVKAEIDAFVGEAPQFDDITMLCLEFIPGGEKRHG